MKIFIGELLKNNQSSEEVNAQETFEDIEVNYETIRFARPVELQGVVTNESGVIAVKGQMHVSLELRCHRCNKKIDYNMVVDLGERYFPSQAEVEDEYVYHGKEIDLNPMIIDNINLHMPMKILCKGDCRGVCTQCGCNLNESSCDCQQENYNPRFEALSKLKDKFK
jgi:uncharacterized protein